MSQGQVIRVKPLQARIAGMQKVEFRYCGGVDRNVAKQVVNTIEALKPKRKAPDPRKHLWPEQGEVIGVLCRYPSEFDSFVEAIGDEMGVSVSKRFYNLNKEDSFRGRTFKRIFDLGSNWAMNFSSAEMMQFNDGLTRALHTHGAKMIVVYPNRWLI